MVRGDASEKVGQLFLGEIRRASELCLTAWTLFDFFGLEGAGDCGWLGVERYHGYRLREARLCRVSLLHCHCRQGWIKAFSSRVSHHMRTLVPRSALRASARCSSAASNATFDIDGACFSTPRWTRRECLWLVKSCVMLRARSSASMDTAAAVSAAMSHARVMNITLLALAYVLWPNAEQ